MSRDRRCGNHAAETPLHASHIMWYVKVKKVFIAILIPKPSFNFRTGWSVGEHAFAWSSKHTLPRLARSTLNELQQNQHEKSSLVCVRVQPVRTGIGAACVEYGRTKWPIPMLNHTNKQTSLVQNNVLFFIFGTLCSYGPLWRGFFSLGKPRKKRLDSLARLIITTKQRAWNHHKFITKLRRKRNASVSVVWSESRHATYADRTLLISSPHWPHEPDTYILKKNTHNGLLRKSACYSADPTLLISNMPRGNSLSDELET